MTRVITWMVFYCCIATQLLYAQQPGTTRPNIIIILADDLGYGDLGINGGDVAVPHLAKLAAEGLQFTDFHSNGAVCSPTRAALLTGRYQQRMGIEKALSPIETGLGDAKAKKEITFAKYLQEAGYYTGVIGKWHLGASPGQSPLDYGFHEFRGMQHGSGDYLSKVTTAGTYDWWHDRELVKETGHNTELITKHSLAFINAHKDQPFFLYIAQNAIHFPWQQAGDTAHRREGFKYNGVKGSLNKLGQHTPDEVRGVIQNMIREMDNSIGSIMSRLRELKLDDNTLVIFCSDNGGIVQYEGGYTNISSNKPYRGEKGDVYEGGHRVPAIAWWPGKIRKGTSNQTLMTMDLAPTLLELAGVSAAKKPVNPFDGVSVTSLLLKNQSPKERKLFWKHRDTYAVRDGNWKLVVNNTDSPELYNLKDDPSEKNNLAAANSTIVRRLVADLEVWKKEVYSGK